MLFHGAKRVIHPVASVCDLDDFGMIQEAAQASGGDKHVTFKIFEENRVVGYRNLPTFRCMLLPFFALKRFHGK